MRTWLRIALFTLICNFLLSIAFGQSYIVGTFAGGGVPGNVQGTLASLGYITAVTSDADGNLYLCLKAYPVVMRLDAVTGQLTRVAGTNVAGYNGDSILAVTAQLDGPSGVALDSSGNIYIADANNHRIRMVSHSTGIITTLAGTGVSGFGDGAAGSAQFASPGALALDSSSNVYVVDVGNYRIREIAGGTVSTVAGNGNPGYNGDNISAITAHLTDPRGVAVDSGGNVFIADAGDHRLRKVAGGTITTIAGTGTAGYNGDSITATTAQLSGPNGVAIGAGGVVYIADSLNYRVRSINSGTIHTIAGTGTAGFSGDSGSASAAQVSFVSALAVDAGGALYIADANNGRIRKVSSGNINTVAGGGSNVADSGSATLGQLDNPSNTAVDAQGRVYIADAGGNRIRMVTGNVITTIAGTGSAGYGGDNGSAIAATLDNPSGVAVDSTGKVYIADTGNHAIRMVSNGTITTIAGTGAGGFGGDNGPATAAQLMSPTAIAVDINGNIYIADTGNHRIRMISGTTITTVAGSDGSGSGGDNGSATSAQLSSPRGVAVDSAGNLYIADTGNHRIRMVAGGVITAFAGTGAQGFGGDSDHATSALLSSPTGVAVDAAGNLYISDTGNLRVRIVSGDTINTIAGNGTRGFAGDGGSALNAEFNCPKGIAVDAGGNSIYLVDSANQRIRVLNLVRAGLAVGITRSGVFRQGSTSGTYNLTVTNLGSGATTGTVTVSDVVSTGASITSMSGSGWTCPSDGNSCMRDDVLAPSDNYPPIVVLLKIAANSPLMLTDTATVSGGGSDSFAANDKAVISFNSAGPLACTATAAGTPTLSADGYSELLGDVVVTCTGGPTYSAGSLAPTTNVTLYVTPSQAITSRLFSSVTNASDALLLIDEPGSGLPNYSGAGFGSQAPQTLCTDLQHGCPAYVGYSNGYPVGVSSVGGNTTAANVYQGVLGTSGSNSVTFSGVPVIPPVAFGVTRTFRITNVRIPAIGLASLASVSVSLTTNPSTVLPVSSGNVTVGTVADPSMAPTVTPSATTFTQCQAPGGPQLSATLNFTESYATAFKTRVAPITNTANAAQSTNLGSQNVPGGSYGGFGPNSASGFIFSGLTGGNFTAGLADFGTRLKAVFTNIPAGVTLYVSGTNTTPAGVIGGTSKTATAVLVSVTGPDAAADGANFGSNGAALPLSATFAPVALTPDINGTAVAVWEVTNSDPSAIDTLHFNVYVDYPLGTVGATGQPGQPVNNVALSFAPEPGGGAFTAVTAPLPGANVIPRFAIAHPYGASFVTIGSCSAATLSVAQAHTGSLSQGQTGATYTVTVSNAANTAPTSGTVTVTESVSSGLTLVSMAGSGWTCPANTNACTRSDALVAGGSYPAITVTVNVAQNATSPQVPSASVSGGGSGNATGSDSTVVNACTFTFSPVAPIPPVPFGAGTGSVSVTTGAACQWTLASDSDWLTITAPASNSGTGPVTVNYSLAANSASSTRTGNLTIGGQSFPVAQLPPPILMVTQTHSTSFVPGMAGATFTVAVSNAAGTSPTSGTITVTETVPTGLTFVSMAGTNWSCTSNVCTWSDPLAPGASLPPITVTVNVAANAPSQMIASAAASGGGSATASASDTVNVTLCSFSLTPPPPVPPVPAGSGTGSVSVVTAAGCPWTVASNADWLTLTSPASNTGNGTVSYSVAVNTTNAQRTGSLTIAGITYSVVQLPPALLTITMSHTGSFQQGQNGVTYSVTVADTAGTSAATGTVTVTEYPPAGLTVASMAGTGWTCAGTACTRTDPLPGGSVYPPITVTVNIAGTTAASVTNQAAVSGGGSIAAIASDPTTILPSIAPFFNGFVNLNSGIMYLQFSSGSPFGYYASIGSSWIYHLDLGYEFVMPGNDGASGVYFWDYKSGHWWYTNPASFPYLYDFTLKAWIYCFPDSHNPGHYQTNPRWFANLATGQSVSM